MSALQIDNILKGIATGEYIREVGSQFGSIWGWDGLLETEATPEQHAAFGASSNVRLCHSEDIDWLGRKWAVILAYRRQGLAQVSAYIASDDRFLETPLTWLTSVFGKPTESPSEFSWVGRDGIVTLTKTPELLQIDARRFTLLERILAKVRNAF
jgi:hypothetical protein